MLGRISWDVHTGRRRRYRCMGKQDLAGNPVTKVNEQSQPIDSSVHDRSRKSGPLISIYGSRCFSVDPLDQRTRVMSCTQLVSQVLPSSGESACSQWHDVGVMLDQMKRARTRFPLTVSSP